MTIEVTEEPMTAVPEYARVPMVFTVDRVLDVTNRDDGQGGFALSERRLEVPMRRITTRSLTRDRYSGLAVSICRSGRSSRRAARPASWVGQPSLSTHLG